MVSTLRQNGGAHHLSFFRHFTPLVANTVFGVLDAAAERYSLSASNLEFVLTLIIVENIHFLLPDCHNLRKLAEPAPRLILQAMRCRLVSGAALRGYLQIFFLPEFSSVFHVGGL
jgi:hypothetical protein